MHPANVSVSAARTGVSWCEQGYNLSSLDQKLTRASAGTIRQTGQADIPFAPRWIGHCEFKRSILASFQAYRENRSDHPTSCKEQKSTESGRFCQSQALGNHPREPTLSPDQTLSPVNRTLDLGRQSPPFSLVTMSPTGTSTPTHHSGVFTGRTRKRFVSYRLRGEYEKPWLEDPKFKRTKYNNYVIYVFVFLGVCAAGVVAFFQIRPAISGPVRASPSLTWLLFLIEAPDMSRL